MNLYKLNLCTRLIVFLSLWFLTCGTVSSVTPLGKGKSAATFSSGGPVTEIFGIKMPIPYTVLRYRYGLNENTDIHTGIHTTMFIMGNIAFDLGLTRHLFQQTGLKLGVSLGLNLYGFYHMHNLKSTRIYPSLSLIGNYRLTCHNYLIYSGIQSIFQYTKPIFVFAPIIGFEIPVSQRFLINIEAKWYAPNEPSKDRVVEYEIKPFDYGAIGFVWGVSYKF